MKRQKILKNFDDLSQLRTTTKRTDEEKNISKQMCQFPKPPYEKARGRHCSGVTYLLRGETVLAGLARAERAAILHGDSILWESPIKYHKCPTFDTKRNAGDFQTSDWPSKTDTNTRCRMSLRKQTNNTLNVNDTNNNCSQLIFQNVHSKEFKFPRGAMLLLVSLWLSNHWSFKKIY